jgi:hypothetical protein
LSAAAAATSANAERLQAAHRPKTDPPVVEADFPSSIVAGSKAETATTRTGTPGVTWVIKRESDGSKAAIETGGSTSSPAREGLRW